METPDEARFGPATSPGPSYTTKDVEVARERSEVEQLQNELMQRIDGLAAHVSHLVDRLGPVLAPDHPQREVGLSGDPDSPLGQWLGLQIRSLDQLAEVVSTTHSRLRV